MDKLQCGMIKYDCHCGTRINIATNKLTRVTKLNPNTPHEREVIMVGDMPLNNANLRCPVCNYLVNDTSFLNIQIENSKPFHAISARGGNTFNEVITNDNIAKATIVRVEPQTITIVDTNGSLWSAGTNNNRGLANVPSNEVCTLAEELNKHLAGEDTSKKKSNNNTKEEDNEEEPQTPFDNLIL